MRRPSSDTWLRSLGPALVLACFSTDSLSVQLDGVSAGFGPASDSIRAGRVSLRADFRRSWFESDYGRLTGAWDLSLGFWDGQRDDIVLMALSPVFRYEFAWRPGGARPYADLGVGVSLLSDNEIDTRELSTRFQFEDRLALGLRFGSMWRHDLALQLMHYSNANFEKPNDGVDILLLSYIYWFEPD